MRKVLSDNHQVAHYWANKVQSEGRAGNMFFADSKIWSYGAHFCIARHLPNGAVAFTTRGYSPSTGRHISIARSAASHLKIVYCDSPDKDARHNMRVAQEEIVRALDDSTAPRIRQTTRDAHKARALHIAERANAYLHALPGEEKQSCARFDITGLEHIREVLKAHEETQKRLAEDAAAAKRLMLQDDLDAWRKGSDERGHRFHMLPVALRVGYHEQYKTEPGYLTIQTSYGAEIPVSFASRLWTMIQAVREAGRPMENIGRPCGVYTLNTIRADGSIVVGCHDIPYSEIERIAQSLGFLETAAA